MHEESTRIFLQKPKEILCAPGNALRTCSAFPFVYILLSIHLSRGEFSPPPPPPAWTYRLFSGQLRWAGQTSLVNHTDCVVTRPPIKTVTVPGQLHNTVTLNLVCSEILTCSVSCLCWDFSRVKVGMRPRLCETERERDAVFAWLRDFWYPCGPDCSDFSSAPFKAPKSTTFGPPTSRDCWKWYLAT